MRRRVAMTAVVVLAFGAAAGVAYATELPSQISSNWAGYAAVTGASTRAYARRFTSVEGTWVQPSATCVAGEPTFSAFWVGIGGYKVSSKALEQVGSEADCSPSGQVTYYAWYEYVPAGPVTIDRVAVSPGDTITATVTVHHDRATVTLTDLTAATSFTHTKLMRSPRPDVSAAEWIAEAPSNCNGNHCTPLQLTDFGSVDFANATATSIGVDGRHAGVIDDPDWIYGAINLQSGQQQPFFSHRLPSAASVSPLGVTGNAFTVTFGSQPPGGTTGTTGTTTTTGTTGATSATGSSGAV